MSQCNDFRREAEADLSSIDLEFAFNAAETTDCSGGAVIEIELSAVAMGTDALFSLISGSLNISSSLGKVQADFSDPRNLVILHDDGLGPGKNFIVDDLPSRRQSMHAMVALDSA